MKPSPLFSLNWRDAAMGIITAVISAALTALYGALQAGPMGATEWRNVGMVSLTAGVAHILRKFFSEPPTDNAAPPA